VIAWLARGLPAHPAIRLLCVIAVAWALPAMPLTDLLLILLLLMAAHARLGVAAIRRFGGGLLRMRWLGLAIIILYVFFTPGDPLLGFLPGISREGLLEAARRLSILATLLGMVYLLMNLTPMLQLAAALAWLVRPLRALGLDADRFGVRLALALDGVAAAENLLRTVRGQGAASLIDAAARVVQQLESGSEQVAEHATMPQVGAPAIHEWLFPLALAALAFWAAG